MKRFYFALNVFSFTIKFFLIYAAGCLLLIGMIYGGAILLDELSQHRLAWTACKWLAGAALLLLALWTAISEARAERQRGGF